VLAVPVVLATFKPDTFRVQRRRHHQSAPERLYPLINDMRAFNAWNPYNLKDPNIRGEYSGPQAGPRGGLSFAGNKGRGQGQHQHPGIRGPLPRSR
jgi:hypothetical protein